MKKRVRIPVLEAKELLDLAKKVREKHLADGDQSPLRPLNWAEFEPMLDEALAKDDEAANLKREMLRAYKRRQHLRKAIVGMLRKSRDILTGIHDNDNMRELGQWGFDVMERTPSLPTEDVPSSKVPS